MQKADETGEERRTKISQVDGGWAKKIIEEKSNSFADLKNVKNAINTTGNHTSDVEDRMRKLL